MRARVLNRKALRARIPSNRFEALPLESEMRDVFSIEIDIRRVIWMNLEPHNRSFDPARPSHNF